MRRNGNAALGLLLALPFACAPLACSSASTNGSSAEARVETLDAATSDGSTTSVQPRHGGTTPGSGTKTVSGTDAGQPSKTGAPDASDATGGGTGPGGQGTSTSEPHGGHGANGVHANGNILVDGQGNTVHLYGVNRSGSEYACVDGFGIFDGPADLPSLLAMKSWKVNAVRVPLNEDCWLGINGIEAQYGGAAYQTAIAAFVDLILANGMYPVLDLHWTAPGTDVANGQQPMPDSDHAVDFWTQVATRFQADPDVVFELFNEPYPDNNNDTDAAWACWQAGGSCPSVPYPVAGMQTLVTAVRATGAKNLLLLGGVDYSNGLTQWLTHEPTDPLNNLAAAWHVYPETICNNVDCWNQVAGPVAAAVPIVTTEIGDSDCAGDFPTSVMSWLDAHDQSYLGWAWDVFGASCENYSLVTDYAGTPNGTYGLAFQAHLAAVNP